jgi:hypothetical protein
MELLGQIKERQIFYCNIRSEEKWFDSVDFENWIAFTIADNDDQQFLHDMSARCLDKGVCYSCSAGQLASLTEDYFDEGIVWRQIQENEKTGKPGNYETAPMTTFHNNFNEGFWFAVTNANQIINEVSVISNQVVCIDCTRMKVRRHILNLIHKINNGWLPTDAEFEAPIYDTNENLK